MSTGSPNDARVILHADMDAFYASVELLRRPELVGKPVIVGGDGRRGVVAAASYAARFYGIRSAMPSTQARRLCPHAIFLPGDHAHYGEVSAVVMDVFRSFSPHIEPLSLDEAFIDATGARRLFGEGAEIADQLRRSVYEATGLWCSVGVAPNKFLAKLASEQAKPKITKTGPEPGRGVFEVRPGAELAFLHPLPVRALWGVGPAMFTRLDRIGVATIGDLASLPLDVVIGAAGKASGRHLHALANGIDARPVESRGGAKSISHEETFSVDKVDHESLNRELVRLADAVAGRLRSADATAKTVTIKVRFGDFSTVTRSTTLPEPTGNGVEIARIAKKMLALLDVSVGVRLIGVGTTGIGDDAPRQLTLGDMGGGAGFGSGADDLSDAGVSDGESWHSADQAIDEIRAKFGKAAIGPAVLASKDGKIKVKRQGDQQWGPTKDGETPQSD